MSTDPTTKTPPAVDVDALKDASTVDEVIASSNVTWSSTDDRGANGDSATERRPG